MIPAKDNISDFFEAIKGNWTPDELGSAGREVWGCFSWKGKQSSHIFVKHVQSNVEACFGTTQVTKHLTFVT